MAAPWSCFDAMTSAAANLSEFPSQQTPLTTLLGSASDEMFVLSGLGGRLHELVERQSALAPLHDRSIEDAQLIDFLVQHLEAVGIFLRLLAENAPAGASIDFEALRHRLPLADLARRLGGERAFEMEAPSGDLDLF